MNDIETISPVLALAASGDTPRPSETMGLNESLQVQPDNGAPGTGLKDSAGTVFNREAHQIDVFGNPKKTDKGVFKKKTGNGARKNAGKPLSGNLVRGAQSKEAPTDQPATPVDQPSGSFVNPSTVGTPGESGAVDAVLVPLSALTPEQCQKTAKSVVNGATAIAKMTRGEHWGPTDMERTELIDSLARVWAEYNLPLLAPIVEFAIVLVTFLFNEDKRRQDMKKMWQWLIGKKPVTITDDEVKA